MMKTADSRQGTKKGQLFSGDKMIAMVIFMAALALAFFLWDSYTSDIHEYEARRDMQKLAAQAVEQLIRTSGVPEDWGLGTVTVPGLATYDREINATKAMQFITLMNSSGGSIYYETNKHLMGLGEYEFYLTVTNLTDSPVQIDGTDFIAGLPLSDDYTDGMPMPRTAIFNGEIVKINFVIWK